jgi:hypothetical protein
MLWSNDSIRIHQCRILTIAHITFTRYAIQKAFFCDALVAALSTSPSVPLAEELAVAAVPVVVLVVAATLLLSSSWCCTADDTASSWKARWWLQCCSLVGDRGRFSAAGIVIAIGATTDGDPPREVLLLLL